MVQWQIQELVKKMNARGVVFEEGLSDHEISAIELKFDFTFPPDFRTFLQNSLPISEGFINWRQSLVSSASSQKIESIMNWPLEGMLFDIRQNAFWDDRWGIRPNTDIEKVRIATQFYKKYSKLIPIYSHRYIPESPSENGNPVFSIYQMDIIYYGYDLPGYFANEFGFQLSDGFEVLTKPIREIEFWSDWAG